MSLPKELHFGPDIYLCDIIALDEGIMEIMDVFEILGRDEVVHFYLIGDCQESP